MEKQPTAHLLEDDNMHGVRGEGCRIGDANSSCIRLGRLACGHFIDRVDLEWKAAE